MERLKSSHSLFHLKAKKLITVSYFIISLIFFNILPDVAVRKT